MKRVAVLGAGSWGIALAKLIHANGNRVGLWEFDPRAAKRLNELREDKGKLPGVRIPDDALVSPNLGKVVEECDWALLAVPSAHFRPTARSLAESGKPGVPVIIATKGLDVESLDRMSEVLAQESDGASRGRTVVLSGPSHAEEAGMGMPTTIVAASPNLELAREVQEAFSGETFRVYTNEDMLGVELAGALKNVIAIAAGVSDGLGFGDNAKSALMTRGAVEIGRLGMAMGARPDTFPGLAGIGDLIVTCMSRHSRNRFVGEHVGKGKSLSEVLAEMVMVAEGVETARAALSLSRKHKVEMPITEQVCEVLFNGKNPLQAVRELMERNFKDEGE